MRGDRERAELAAFEALLSKCIAESIESCIEMSSIKGVKALPTQRALKPRLACH